jgi:alanyl-tRNA synthetase
MHYITINIFFSHRNFSVEFCGGTHLTNTTEAKAFALISEEGIAKGVRRIVAFTGEEAERAIAEGASLAAEVEAAKALSDTAELDKAIKTIVQVLDVAVIPAPHKAQIREELNILQKKVIEAAKAQFAANKMAAVAAVAAAADAAVAAGKSYLVLKLDVGSDQKAIVEAWLAASTKHTHLSGLFLSADESKAIAYASVPDAVHNKIKANDWVNEALKVLDGKGGGKAGVAQGQGPSVSKINEAAAIADQFASLKLN